MDKKKFLHVCNLKDVAIIPSDSMEEKLKRYKLITKHFKYLCAFDEHGTCVARPSNMCCCRECTHAIGYLKNIRVGTEEVYASKYNSKTGFWKQDIGCTLPRDMRSETCVGYVCLDTYEEFKSINGKRVTNFMDLLRRYNHLSQIKLNTLDKLYLEIKDTV